MCSAPGAIQPSEVALLEKLKQSEDNLKIIFKARLRGSPCIMKVYHNHKPTEDDSPELEVNLFICESTAYNRLKQIGLCERGDIPKFYSTLTGIQVCDFAPHLAMFSEDELPPCAVFLEYIPNMQQLDLSTYSPQVVTEFRRILDTIHRAKVMHGDTYPRNMMVCSDFRGSGRAKMLWIDFDNAQTFPEDRALTERQESWFVEENELADYFFENLAKDHADGKISSVWDYYYTWL
ncbi:hypothetical protein BJX61DRAFT_551965 [Aspergillus egyptiacus]|nr:hypothetical protein BJX61DRAFT_551965 [Aspergillus egyptiacus]